MLLYILIGESDLGSLFEVLEPKNETGVAAAVPVSNGMVGAGRLPIYIITIPVPLRVPALCSGQPRIGVM